MSMRNTSLELKAELLYQKNFSTVNIQGRDKLFLTHFPVCQLKSVTRSHFL